MQDCIPAVIMALNSVMHLGHAYNLKNVVAISGMLLLFRSIVYLIQKMLRIVLINRGEKVGLYEREEDSTDSFDLNNDVLVFLDPDYVALVPDKVSTCYSHMLILLEIRFIKYFPSGCIFCR